MKLPLLGRDPETFEPATEVDVAVTGAMDDAVAIGFAQTLAEAMGASLWREGPRPEGRVVATGLRATANARARLHIVISGGVPRAAWRASLQCDLELSDPRKGVAEALGAQLARPMEEW